ncbi:MAG: hypothetical protein JJE03_03235 [Peptostreptococcaceae bacterium]|nr:hypothetical protein [Peptostreptococcaceae bacterium]
MKYSDKFSVTSHDIDYNNVIRPEQLQMYLQESADHQSRDEVIPCDELYKNGYSFILSRINIEIYKPIRKYDEITVNTWHIKGRAANYPRAYEIIKDDEVVVKAMSNWALIEVENKKLVKYNDYDMTKYSIDKPLEMELKERFRISKDLEMDKVDTFKVNLSDTDFNRHLNNTRYLKIIYDNIPDMENSFITSINLRYMKEAPIGSNIEIFRSKAREPIGIDSRADKVYTFYTLVNGNNNLEAEIGIKKYERCNK